MAAFVFSLLLDDPGVTSFDSDSTYKRIKGKMNEWELSIFAKLVLRGTFTISEVVFDEVQRIKLLVTGKPMPLKRFVPDMNSDMDAAQILGIFRSVMKANVPEYSHTPNDTPSEKVAPEFVQICWRHAKEPVHDFRARVSDADFRRLQDFVYISSKEALGEFSTFIDGLGEKRIKEVTDGSAEIKTRLAALKELRRESSAQTKQLNEDLKALTGKSTGRSAKGKALLSSRLAPVGRVKTVAPSLDLPSTVPRARAATQLEDLPGDGATQDEPVLETEGNILLADFDHSWTCNASDGLANIDIQSAHYHSGSFFSSSGPATPTAPFVFPAEYTTSYFAPDSSSLAGVSFDNAQPSGSFDQGFDFDLDLFQSLTGRASMPPQTTDSVPLAPDPTGVLYLSRRRNHSRLSLLLRRRPLTPLLKLTDQHLPNIDRSIGEDFLDNPNPFRPRIGLDLNESLIDGTVHPVEIVSDGKLVTKLVMAPPLAQTTIPEVARRLNHELVFVGSSVGPSVLFKAARIEEEIEPDQDADMHAVAQVDEPMNVYDDDEDIYGPSKAQDPVSLKIAKKTRTVTHLTLCDTIEAYGSIADMTFSIAWNGDRPVPELVAATGTGPLGGFTLFQCDLPIRTKRKLHAIGGARGMWSLPIRQPLKSGNTLERPLDPFQAENDSLIIISTDVNPSPGLSRIAHRGPKNDITISVRIPGTTIGAGSFFQRTAILHVTTNAIRVLEPGEFPRQARSRVSGAKLIGIDGAERQIIKDVGSMPRPKIRACSISDPYVIVIREDDSIGMFIETDRGRIRRKDMSAMGDKGSSTVVLKVPLSHGPLANSAVSVEKNQPSTLSGVGSGNRSKWLALVRPQGVIDSRPILLPESMSESTSESVSESVFLRSGQLAIYEAVPGSASEERPTAVRASTLNLKFVKVLSKSFPIQRPDEADKSIIAEQRRISRQFIPFLTSRPSGHTLSGVFFTGDRPSWISATNKSCVKIHPSGHSVVHAFTACSLWESKGDFLLYSEEGPSILEWLPDFNLDTPLPTKYVPRGRSYSNVVFDLSTSLIVAASSLQAKFASFDEDGNRMWEPDAPNVSDPLCDCSCLELISPDLWITMDGFEFATNEFITDVACVTLETPSTETGSKEFMAVGTTIDRGEDLAAKGSTYVFEIVEVVPDPSLAPERWYKLRLRFRDNAKGPVTAVCGFNGYLVSSMGQKVSTLFIFVRAFDDDRLVGVAFLNVTSLRTLKNLLLIGDAVKSITFVAFQVCDLFMRSIGIIRSFSMKEDPYKLVILAKDITRVCVTSADFFFAEGEMSIITSDEEGVIRMYEYNPNGSTDGSLKSLTPVDEATAKRLQLLQGQLTRNIQHVAGLNPKALRIVRNDYVSKPLSKGVLDGNLLTHFEGLPISRQNEMTRQIGTERTHILRDWMALAPGAW
ncbi:CPSF A subunit region-domain-containing protein [Mycena vitilis]|nr:CPSF A subunit region-domain-containing protein [Mycena vitilis]